MLNKISIMGRLVRDPELRRTQNDTAVATFTLAVDRDFTSRTTGEKETDFLDCVAWRNTAEFISKYFGKGQMMVVSGSLQIRNWTDKDGGKRRNAEVIVSDVYFCERPKQKDDVGQQAAPDDYSQLYGDDEGCPF